MSAVIKPQLSPAQQRAYARLRDGWSARQHLASNGLGDRHGMKVRCVAPDRNATDWCTVQTMQSLVRRGLATERVESRARVWEVVG